MDFMVNSMLKKTQRYFFVIHRMSYQGCVEEKKENDYFCTSSGRDDQIATSAKLFDIAYKSYGFSGGQTKKINWWI